MKNSEYIEKLQQYPQDTHIYIFIDDEVAFKLLNTHEINISDVVNHAYYYKTAGEALNEANTLIASNTIAKDGIVSIEENTEHIAIATMNETKDKDNNKALLLVRSNSNL